MKTGGDRVNGLSLKQAQYQARRVYLAEYNRQMNWKTPGPGRQSERIDTAQTSAQRAYVVKLREWGW